MFNLSKVIPNVPRISDVINISTNNTPDILRLATYAWVWFLGGWFFAGIFGTLAAALYIKSQNTIVPIAFLLLTTVMFQGIYHAVPSMGNLPAADVFVDLIGVFGAFAVGFFLYSIYRGKK
jgi:hypothetical protein